MWRSGSSLLYALLNKHPQFKLMYQAELAVLVPGKKRQGGFERITFANGLPHIHFYQIDTSWPGFNMALREAKKPSSS
jgi:hypothetical protein